MVNWFIKLKHIIIGWYRFLFKPMPDWARDRYEICKRCSHNELIIKQLYCSRCGCHCKSKCNVEDEECLDGRWFKIKNENER